MMFRSDISIVLWGKLFSLLLSRQMIFLTLFFIFLSTYLVLEFHPLLNSKQSQSCPFELGWRNDIHLFSLFISSCKIWNLIFLLAWIPFVLLAQRSPSQHLATMLIVVVEHYLHSSTTFPFCPRRTNNFLTRRDSMVCGYLFRKKSTKNCWEFWQRWGMLRNCWQLNQQQMGQQQHGWEQFPSITSNNSLT
jgi:hypothetical protein